MTTKKKIPKKKKDLIFWTIVSSILTAIGFLGFIGIYKSNEMLNTLPEITSTFIIIPIGTLFAGSAFTLYVCLGKLNIVGKNIRPVPIITTFIALIIVFTINDMDFTHFERITTLLLTTILFTLGMEL